MGVITNFGARAASQRFGTPAVSSTMLAAARGSLRLRGLRLPPSAVGQHSLYSSTSQLLYTERMAKTGRPRSPALTIYRLPAIAWSSVMVRISGVVASFTVAGVAGVSLLGGKELLADLTHEVVASNVGPAAKFFVAFMGTYHWAGNIRHAYWDLTAKGFNNKTMLHSAYGLGAGVTILSLAAAMYTLPPPPAKSEK